MNEEEWDSNVSTHLVTFSDESMSRSRELCAKSAMLHGVDFACEAGPGFPVEVDGGRGLGFWKWKPDVIDCLMSGRKANSIAPMNDGEILIYSDAGIEFINNVNYIVDRMDQDIFLFGNMYDHAHWCKRDIVEAIWPKFTSTSLADAMDFHSTWDRFGKQVQASVIFFRVSDWSRAFVKEWLDWCLFEGGRLIDDSPSRTPNHPEFQENRHDQAILTTMAYRDGLKLSWWPASYNEGQFTYPRGDYPDEGYPILFHHHRRREADWAARDKFVAECDAKVNAVFDSIPDLERVG